MMFQPGHGARTLTDTARAKAIGMTQRGDFAFLFPDQTGVPMTPTTRATLSALAAEMVKGTADPQAENSTTLPPFMTYLGQFIDHDLTSVLNKDITFENDIDEAFMPHDRSRVVAALANQRTGVFDLDSLYGTTTPKTPLEARLVKAMRHPSFKAKMRIAFPQDVNSSQLGNPARVTPPADGANDLLRLGEILGGAITEAELNALTDEGLRSFFFKTVQGQPDAINRHRAIIGDPRNDENLFVAQMHLAWLRLHNRIVDHAPAKLAKGPEAALFDWAQDQTRLVYQHVVLFDWLKRLCDPDVFEFVMNKRAPLYSQMMARRGGDTATLPLPIEFSFAAFRFGHSMARDAYDWNAEFTNASFNLLFSFTGHNRNPMFGITDARLPSNWPADWARLASPVDPALPMRATRKIDTHVAPPLGALPQDARVDLTDKLRNLAERNLLRALLMNVPSAQGCLAGIQHATGFSIPALTQAQMLSNAPGKVLAGSDLMSNTPLWFYTLQEAEIMGGGERLGPLGSMLVADTIVGLMIHDPKSLLNRVTNAGTPWTPDNGVKPDGVVINTFQDVLKAALLL